MGKYSEERATATELIDEFGSEMSYKRITADATYDPVTGTFGSTETTFTSTTVALPLSTSTRLQIQNTGVSLDNREAYKLLVAVGNTAPQNNDFIVIDGKDFEIFQFSKLDPALDGEIFYKGFAVK